MTETAGLTRPAAGAQTPPDGTAVCVFAVCHPQTAPDLDGLTGHPGGGPVRTLAAGPLTLITQSVPAADFAPEACAERFSDPAALESCARAHHAVIAAVARGGPVVPLPLATLYLGPERATAAVAGRADRLLALLERLRHRAEWGLKVYPVRSTPPAADPPGPDSAPAADTGRAYLDRLRNRQQERERQHETAWRTAEHVYAALARQAAAARRLRPQDPALTGGSRRQVLNAALLLNHDREREFRDTVAALARDPAVAAHARIEVTGPWVPYSFARLDDEEQERPADAP